MTTTLIILLVASVLLNGYQKFVQMRTTKSGRAALEAIAGVSNYVQEAAKKYDTVAEIREALARNKLTTISGDIFDYRKVHKVIKKQLKSLWAAGAAKIKEIL